MGLDDFVEGLYNEFPYFEDDTLHSDGLFKGLERLRVRQMEWCSLPTNTRI